MADLLSIAETMSVEFTGAVREAQRAQAAAVDDLAAKLEEADEARQARLSEVRRMREEAARIVADSLKREESAEREFGAALRAIRADLNAMRAPQPVAVAPVRPHVIAAE